LNSTKILRTRDNEVLAQQQNNTGNAVQKPDHFTFDPTLPASVKVVGQAGSLNDAPDANHPMPGVAAVSGNLFSEQIVGLTGQPAQGNFTTTEHIQPMLGNIHSPSVTSGALHGANLVDFIGFTSKSSSFGNANLYNLQRQTFTVTLPSGVSYPLSTVINQWSQMRNGSLTAAYPTVINP
jgi:hypothetical protein